VINLNDIVDVNHTSEQAQDAPVLISNKFLIHLDRIFLERGGDMFKVLQEADLPYETILSDELMIPYENHIRLLELSSRELGVESIGLVLLVLSTRQMVVHLTPIFDALLSATSVRNSIFALCENLQFVIEGVTVNLRLDGDLAYLELFAGYPFIANSHHYHDHGSGLLAQYLRWIVGKQFRMLSVSIPHSEPRDIVRFRSFFGCPVSFSDSHIAICFEKAVLDRPVVGARDNAVKEYNEVLGWDRSTSLLAQVRTIIRKDIETDFVANAMNLSRRTLQRRLQEKGTSFHKQVDSVRAGLARKFVYDASLSIADIAVKLGYAEPECFTRAFLRWYAKSPCEWRTLINGADP